MRPDPASESTPERDGWTLRFVVAPPRLEEAASLYQAMGFEVRLDAPWKAGPGCPGCPVHPGARALYTRRKS